MNTVSTIHKALHEIQQKLKAPKNKKNDFGGFNYRTTEGMLAAAKPLLPEGATIVLSDEPKEVAGQLVLISKARFTFGDEWIEASSFALHSLQKKGMDAAQISGSTSSYARKYALAGLLSIDDSEGDPDSKAPHDPRQEAIEALKGCINMPSLQSVWAANKGFHHDGEVLDAKDKRKAELEVKQN